MTLGGIAPELWSTKAQIRDARRSAAIADAFELRECGDWTYAIDPDVDKAVIISYKGDQERLEVPRSIDGVSVYALYNKAFYRNEYVKEIDVPDCVLRLGVKAFGQCKKLKRVVLPAGIKTLPGDLFEGCNNLEEVRLPKALETLPSKLLERCCVRHLFLPASCTSIEERSLNTDLLESVSVEAGNTTYTSDGLCLYSADGSTLLQNLCARDNYKVLEGTTGIGNSAFKNFRGLARVTFPEGLEHIDDYAFMGCGLESLAFPESLKRIGDRSFHNCQVLASVQFNDGLEHIGHSAFAGSAIEEVRLPFSMRTVSPRAFDNTNIDFKSSFCIDERNPYLFSFDGALYANGDDGFELLGALGSPTSCEVLAGTRHIADEAFAHREKLESILLPEGLLTIGDRAFCSCFRLQGLDLPASVESIGKEAFWLTSLTHMTLGPGLKYLGDDALQSAGVKWAAGSRTLKTVDVDSNNELFYIENDFLCKRGVGGDTAILFLNNVRDAVFPLSVDKVADKALFCAEVDSIHVHRGIHEVMGPRAFGGLCGLARVNITLGDDSLAPVISLHFPGYAYEVDRFASMFIPTDEGFFDFREYDSWIRSTTDAALFARMVLARLKDPVCLEESFRTQFVQAIRDKAPQVLRACIGSHDLRFLTDMHEVGLLDDSMIDLGLAVANDLGETPSAAYLLSLRNAKKANVLEEDFSL